MPRKLALLVTAVALTVTGGVVGAGFAAAAPSPRSVHNYCVGASTNAHPGNHNGWFKQDSLERRNVGGTCPAG
ncbi:hypothetical protein [Blastococcus sp. CT_GayMR16]|uniref:hypothetical protein n=1 Tax=Blastococcus sp. CT_GayMR16 TaxID=2559607 RepID=UPI0010740D07|nr:hypothetical protein [Blastococcus sp. CT_GayMR16]TFV87820.1 hypothetical protein E4P38_12670 [Blastococcus sp. CT_GayMR16]